MDDRDRGIAIVAAVIVIMLGVYAFFSYQNSPDVLPDTNNQNQTQVIDFQTCVQAGGPIMESYPRQCSSNGKTYTEEIGNESEKNDLIRISFPRPNGEITSPLKITGEARGTWFFEASFPIVLTNWDGLIIAEGYAEAKSDWMTTEFVPFEATLNFVNSSTDTNRKGYLILKKDNPSGLPEHEDSLEIPVYFSKETSSIPPSNAPVFCTQDVKVCPDGSYVGRGGPNCEFAQCPGSR